MLALADRDRVGTCLFTLSPDPPNKLRPNAKLQFFYARYLAVGRETSKALNSVHKKVQERKSPLSYNIATISFIFFQFDIFLQV
jgi:hypothetical protein